MLHRSIGEVENSDCTSAVRQRFAIDAAGSRDFQFGFRRKNILIDGDDLVVGQQFEGGIIHARDVAAQEKRSGEKTPERELGPLFLGRQIGLLVGRIRTVRMPMAPICSISGSFQ